MIRVLDILEDYLYQMNMGFERLDGRIRGNDRQAAIDRFCKKGKITNLFSTELFYGRFLLVYEK